MGEVDLVVVIPFVRFHRKLVSAGFANQLEHMSNVEFALDELLLQIVQKLWIGSRIPCPDIIDWLNDPNPEQIPPKSVDVAFCEVPVIR